MEENYADLSDTERQEQMATLRAELAAHPGALAHRAWRELARSQAIVTANAAELLGVLRAPGQNTELAFELIQNVRPRTVHDQYFMLLDQRLHNLLASVVTLVDHRRRTLDAYEGSTFESEFFERNSRLLAMPATVFVRDFRNYLLHYGHAPMATRVSLNHAGATTRLAVDTAALLASTYEWKSGARRLLEDSPDGLELEPTVVAYLEALDDLDRWWAGQFDALHGADVAAADDIVRRLNLTLTAGTSDGRDREMRMAHVAENSARRERGEPQISFEQFAALSEEDAG